MMFKLLGVFIILHGIVHLLYFGQSRKLFELKPGMTWPVPSWALSKILGDRGIRKLAGILCFLAAVGLVTGGIGILVELSWWDNSVAISVVLSTVLYILFWDGKICKLSEKGGIGVLINLGILCLVYFVFKA